MPELLLEERVARLEGRVEGFNGRLDHIEHRLDDLENKLYQMGNKLMEKIGEVDLKLTKKVDDLYKWIISIQIATWVTIMTTILLKK